MSVVFLVIVLISGWYGLTLRYRRQGTAAAPRLALLSALLLTTGLLIVLTELLDALSWLDATGVKGAWGGVAVAGLGWAFFEHRRRSTAGRSARGYWMSFSPFERFLLSAAAVVASLTLFTALVYPPNNNDSMAYHMARVAHWVQNRSIQPYPTYIEPQLHHPPLAEWGILHLYWLAGSDLFANLMQWVAYAGSLAGLSLLARLLGGNRLVQAATVFVAATVPMVILQSSSTQNDVVEAFFLITLNVFLLHFYQTRHRPSLWLGALALAAAWLTKGTGYLYSAPLLLTWGLAELSRVRKARWMGQLLRLAGNSLLLLGVGALFNAGHYARNQRVYDDILIDKAGRDVYTNQIHTPAALASNLGRNLGVHFGVPGLHLLSQYALEGLHERMGLDIRDERTTYGRYPFDLPILSNNEDNASNFLHLLWLTGCGVYLLRVRRRPEARPFLLLAAVVTAEFVLFCGLLKWQPWNSRLHTAMFLLAAPVGGYGLSRLGRGGQRVVVGLLLASALAFALTNFSRPLLTIPPLTRDDSFLRGRFTNYYVNERGLEPIHGAIGRFLNQQPADSLRVGLMYADYEWDYPWFRQVKPGIRLHHIRVTSASRVLDTHPPVDYIISTQPPKDTLWYQNRVYRRLPVTRERAFLYAPD